MYHASLTRCPHCECVLETHMFALSSGIGPSQIRCWKCQHPVALDRAEWPDMSPFGRIWYIGITFVYIAIFGVLTGNAFDNIEQLRAGQKDPENLRLESPDFHTGACVGAAVVVCLQLYRIIASYRRHESDYTFTPREYFLGVQWHLQLKCLILLVLIWGAAELLYGW